MVKQTYIQQIDDQTDRHMNSYNIDAFLFSMTAVIQNHWRKHTHTHTHTHTKTDKMLALIAKQTNSLQRDDQIDGQMNSYDTDDFLFSMTAIEQNSWWKQTHKHKDRQNVSTHSQTDLHSTDR